MRQAAGDPAHGAPSRLARLDRDRHLVVAAQADLAQFDALYRRYLAQVYSFAYYELGNHADAEDATERTFLSALTALPRFEERARPADGEGASTFRIWLFQIARNEMATQLRDRRRHPQVDLDEILGLEAADDPAATAIGRADSAGAWAAVASLPLDRRRAIWLKFVDQMSTAEIAGVLGRSEGAVRVLIHRGLRSLARDLGGPDARRRRPQ